MCSLDSKWTDRFRAFCKDRFKRLYLECTDFGDQVTLTHPDGTTLVFRNALFIKRRDGVLVMTEHCGYHVFPSDCKVS
jgi:hypothetical protein